VHERIGDRAFDGLAELRARHQQRMDVHAVGIQRDIAGLDFLVVNRDQHEIDVRLGPHRVVRQAAAQDGGKDGAILLDLFDQLVEGCGEFLMNRPAHESCKDSVCLTVGTAARRCGLSATRVC
jgi:hypothetical protein